MLDPCHRLVKVRSLRQESDQPRVSREFNERKVPAQTSPVTEEDKEHSVQISGPSEIRIAVIFVKQLTATPT